MATITARTNDKVFSVQKWYGLNEHPDGDTRLRMGEASKMVNWRITRDGNLKLRPGQEFVAGLGPEYEAVISEERRTIGTFQATDVLFVYNEISDTATPGALTPVGGDAAIVDHGSMLMQMNSVEQGTLRFGDPDNWSVSNGTLTGTGQAGQMVTPEGLAPLLEALEDGEYLYYQQEGVMYALPNDGLTETRDGYVLSGMVTTAEAVGTPEPVVALWSGVMNGKDIFLAACDDKIYSLYNQDTDLFAAAVVGAIPTDKGVHFFQFDGIIYVLNGYDYYYYDGTVLAPVPGYTPLVAITIGPIDTPDGPSEAGTLTGEYVNRLSKKRRVWLSPDGTNASFRLPEEAHTIDAVTDLSGDGTTYTATFTPDGKDFSLSPLPPKAVNSIEVEYSVTDDYRSQVAGMLFSEFYSGTTDTRIFLYGDGSNKAIYSGMDYDGLPRADYFPDQYEVRIGDANEQITAMVRHGGALIAYKPRECWSLQHGVVELATGDLTPSIYTTPMNREKGNDAPGQVCLVDNAPITVSGTELYRWGAVSRYSSAIGRDERNATRISDRIQKSIKEFNFKTCRMWDDNDHQEFYLCGDRMAMVWNYAVDAWYRYENFDATAICSFHGDLYVGSHDGKLRRMSDYVTGDDGAAIPAVWESGAIDFGAAYSRKYSAALWVGLKPVDGTSVDVTVETDRKNTFRERLISSEKAKIPGQPFMVKTKLKAKKFVYYRLILKVDERMLPVTVTNVEIRVRMTSDAK